MFFETIGSITVVCRCVRDAGVKCYLAAEAAWRPRGLKGRGNADIDHAQWQLRNHVRHIPAQART
eukprot:COSAG05_NODE_1422_length_4926_cov_14.914647_2_plen_65_part_00